MTGINYRDQFATCMDQARELQKMDVFRLVNNVVASPLLAEGQFDFLFIGKSAINYPISFLRVRLL